MELLSRDRTICGGCSPQRVRNCTEQANTLSSGRRVTDRQVSALEFGGPLIEVDLPRRCWPAQPEVTHSGSHERRWPRPLPERLVLDPTLGGIAADHCAGLRVGWRGCDRTGTEVASASC